MKVSQLLHVMGRDEFIVIDDYDKPINEMTLYRGTVRGIKKDNPINKMHVESVRADDNIILVLAINPQKKGGE